MKLQSGRALKSLLYRLSFWSPLSIFLKFFLTPFVSTLTSVKNDKKRQEKKPFYIVVTIDTESGYVDSNEKRLWQIDHPDLYEGFYYGIRNWLDLLNKNKVKASFMLSSQCFSAMGKEREMINKQLSNIIAGNHELGYHLHPRSDQSLEKILGEKLKFTSSKFYSQKKISDLLKAGRYLLIKNLGMEINKQIVSFRWGNFGLYRQGINVLKKNGFFVDTSVCPGRKGHQFDDKIFDWSKIVNSFPYFISQDNLLEIPATTFKIFNKVLLVDPVNHLFLEQAFLKYWQRNNASKQPFFFVMSSHTSEGTDKVGRPTKVIQTMQDFFEKVKQYENVEFITLKQAEEIYRDQHDTQQQI